MMVKQQHASVAFLLLLWLVPPFKSAVAARPATLVPCCLCCHV
jgi:hypothetical protein